MSKHTPGPWKAHKPGRLSPMEHDWTITGNASPDPVTEARYLFVARVLKTAHPDPMWRQDEENEANARLIAAAPDLLEALKWAIEAGRIGYVRRTNTNGDYCDGVDHARAAIAKAEGGAS